MRLTILILTLFCNTTLTGQDKKPTNKHFWCTMQTTASPDSIWSVWIDVNQWKVWDTGLKDAALNGVFRLGATGTIISLEGRKSKFKVIDYEEGKSYIYKTKLPLGSLYVKRYLTTENNQTSFTHEVWFKGLTKGIFAKAFGGKFRKMLPEVLLNIKKIVEDDNND